MKKPTPLRAILTSSLVLLSLVVFSQTEYRITEDGAYQYLSVRKEANMIFDESMGTYYKPITERTFYLETYRKGYLPKELSYTQFTRLSVDEQRAIVNQPYRDIECSVNNPSPDCMAMEENQKIEKLAGAKVIDLNPKCTEEHAKSKQKDMPWTTKLLMNPDDENLENIDCGEVVAEQRTEKTQAPGKQAPSTMKILLGVDE